MSTGQTHPSYLSTAVIQRAMDLSSVSSPVTPIQLTIKGGALAQNWSITSHLRWLNCNTTLDDEVYQQNQLLTRKARETMALKQQAKLSRYSLTDG